MAFAANIEVRGDAPDQYVVVKGDTLWDISAKFFKDPWKWPYIWGMNKDSVKDPHWIYPGDVIILDRTSGTLRMSRTEAKKDVINISPKVHEGSSTHDTIPSIPANVIEPFLSQPLIIEEGQLKNMPTLIGAREGRLMLGTNDTGFVKNLFTNQGFMWRIYRPGKVLTDPDTNEVLGTEGIYLGNAETTLFADISTVLITRSVLEITHGDILIPSQLNISNTYLPRAPTSKIIARVISTYGSASQAGPNTVIILNKGKRDGLENGHVLALYRKGENLKNDGKELTAPDERYGLIFVFRVFEKASYALVVKANSSVQTLDRAQTP